MTRWILSRPRGTSRVATPARLALTPLEDRAVPAVISVSNTNNSGSGSLRAAIVAVNASADTTNAITFIPGLTGTITLTSDFDTIAKPVSIQGPGAALLTVNGAGSFKLFSFDDGAAAATTGSIVGLTISNGKNAATGGGGVYSKNENVTVQDAVIQFNTAVGNNGGGVRADGGTFTLLNTTVNGNSAADGGGVANAGATFVVTGGSITSNNATGNGGGYFQSAGALQDMTATTVSGNTAGGIGGGLDLESGPATLVSSLVSGNSASGNGGGVEVNGGSVALKNATVTGNSSKGFGGGVRYFGGTLEIRNSTIAFNVSDSNDSGAEPGGGISVVAATPAKLFSTIVAKNTRSAAAVKTDIEGALDATSANNLIGVDTGLTGVTNATLGNLVGTAMTPRDPLLNPLAFNGGTTKTLSIQTASAAKDAGDDAGLGVATDGRGAPFARVVGAKADIGAFEVQSAAAALVVTTSADRNNSTFTPGDVSLREALRFAGTDAPTVTFAPTLSGQTITLVLGRLLIDRALTVQGPGAGQLTVSGNDASQVLRVTDGDTTTAATVTVSGLKLSNGKGGVGGAVINFENLTLDGVTISDSQATSDGGGIDNEAGGTLLITNSTITNNKSATRGGGVFNFSAGTVSILNSTVSNNQTVGAGTTGGGVGNTGTGPLIITSSTVSGNKAEGDGGGLFNGNAGAVTVKNSTISGNQANNNGGGVALTAGSVTINNSTVALNKAEADGAGAGKGGGIFVGGGTAKMTGTIVAKNDVGATGANIDISGLVVGKFSLVLNTTGWDQTGSVNNKLAVDPLLGALQNNGGPTFTHAPAAGSPAIDPGFADADINPDALATDQRGTGFPRKVGAGVDIGAVEFNPNTPPTISDVPNQTTATGVATAAIPFTVGDAETPAAALTVVGTSSNTTLVPNANIVVAGTGASRTVTVTPAAGQNGTATITLTVTDGSGAVATDTFTLTVAPAAANTAPTISAVGNVTVATGVATAAIPFTVGDAESAPGTLVVTATSSNTTLVPNANIVFGGSGANRTVTVTPAAGQNGTATITLTVSDGALTATRTFTLTANAGGVAISPVLVGFPQFAAGSDAGTGGSATLYNPDKSARFTVTPFGSDFNGGVRTAAADFNGDGVADLVVGTGPGRATRVRVLDGVTQARAVLDRPVRGGVHRRRVRRGRGPQRRRPGRPRHHPGRGRRAAGAGVQRPGVRPDRRLLRHRRRELPRRCPGVGGRRDRRRPGRPARRGRVRRRPPRCRVRRHLPEQRRVHHQAVPRLLRVRGGPAERGVRHRRGPRRRRQGRADRRRRPRRRPAGHGVLGGRPSRRPAERGRQLLRRGREQPRRHPRLGQEPGRRQPRRPGRRGGDRGRQPRHGLRREDHRLGRHAAGAVRLRRRRRLHGRRVRRLSPDAAL